MTLQDLDAQFVARFRTAVAAQLPEYLPRQRWFGSKTRNIQSVRLYDCVPVQLSRSAALVALVIVEFVEGSSETYVLPLVATAQNSGQPAESVVLCVSVSDQASELLFVDAVNNREFLSAILDAILKSDSFSGENGTLCAISEPTIDATWLSSSISLTPRLLTAEQSHTSIVYGDQLILKLFRCVHEGLRPEFEIGRFLASVARFPNVPPLCGSLNYQSHDSRNITLGILQRFVPNRGDAWRFIVDSLTDLIVSPDYPAGPIAPESNPPAPLAEQLELIRLLGKRTAELHLALASSSSDPAFAPEPFTPEFRAELDRAFHDLAVRNFETLRLKLTELPAPVAALAQLILKLEDDALLTLHSVLEIDISSIRTRIHGDYHLGQVLFTGSDFFIIDFEGEPARALSERRNKRSPLQDVAGMLRSFHYAARSASLAAKERMVQERTQQLKSQEQIDALASQWQSLASHEFLRSYRATAGDAKFLPAAATDFDALLKVYLLEKAIYELGYELNNRPSWLAIPLEGIRDILTANA